MSKIETRDLRFFYGDFEALEGISMKIEERSITALIGPSGCGKSIFITKSSRPWWIQVILSIRMKIWI